MPLRPSRSAGETGGAARGSGTWLSGIEIGASIGETAVTFGAGAEIELVLTGAVRSGVAVATDRLANCGRSAGGPEVSIFGAASGLRTSGASVAGTDFMSRKVGCGDII